MGLIPRSLHAVAVAAKDLHALREKLSANTGVEPLNVLCSGPMINCGY